MWQNSDYKKAFKNYAPSPPPRIWEGIAQQLEIEHEKPIGFWSFTSAQKYTLLAACLVSVLFSSFIFKIESNTIEPIAIKTETLIKYTHPAIVKQKLIATPSVNYSKTELASEILHSKQIVENASNKSNLSPKQLYTKKIIVLPLPKEFNPFKKEINELYEIDLAIAKLSHELNALESITTPLKQPEIEYRSTYNEENARTINLAEFNTTKKQEIESKTEATKQEQPTSFLNNIISKLYITPFVGGNFTQVSYTSSSNSPYFSQNASFTGKLGYNAGIQLGYQVNKKWGIESGISFGQYLQNFYEKLNSNSSERNGIMYIDQLDIPLLARYTIPLKKSDLPLNLSFKGGLIYNSVIQYQVNYADELKLALPPINPVKSYSIDADKRTYNSLQLGYALGMDFDAFISKKISLNLSLLNAYVSQLENFPSLSSDVHRPLQFTSSFSIGTKIRF
jgi:hypothetical protein